MDHKLVIWIFVAFLSCVESLNLTVTPFETTEFDGVDVTVRCEAAGLEDALTIRSMEISKPGSKLPLATLYPIDSIVHHTELLQHIQAAGHIGEGVDASNSFLSINLNDPVHTQSGEYVCLVNYINRKHILKTARASSTLKINAVDKMGTILKELKQLKQQHLASEETHENHRLKINSIERSLSKKESEILILKKTVTKLAAENNNLEKQMETSMKACCKNISTDLENVSKELTRKIEDVSCHGEWQYFNGLCYKEVNLSLNWYNANIHCNRLGGSLAIIPDAETNEFLREELKFVSPHGHWIGLSNIANYEDNKDEFTWVDGRELTYSNWKKNRNTVGAKQMCVDFFLKGEWNNFPCDVSAGDEFICQIHPSKL